MNVCKNLEKGFQTKKSFLIFPNMTGSQPMNTSERQTVRQRKSIGKIDGRKEKRGIQREEVHLFRRL